MSILMREFLDPKYSMAKAFASSVFLTPVGPMKRKLKIGRLGFQIPMSARRITRHMAATASGCPTICFCKDFSNFNSFWDSSFVIFSIWIPFKTKMVCCICSSSTFSASFEGCRCRRTIQAPVWSIKSVALSRLNLSLQQPSRNSSYLNFQKNKSIRYPKFQKS